MISRKYTVWVFLAGWVLLSGCPAIHRARDAQNPKKTPPGERTVTAEEAGIAADSTITLDRAIEIATNYHPSAVQARQNVEIARVQYRNAVSGYLTSAQTSAGYSRGTSNVAPNKPTNRAQDNYSANLGLNMTVFDFGKTPALVRQANANKIASEKSLESAINDLTYQVTVAYYGLIQAQSLLTVAMDQERDFRVHLEQVQALFEVGRNIKLDVTKAGVDWNNSKLSLLNAQNGVLNTRAALNQAMGLAECPVYQVTEPPVDDYNPNLDNLMAATREKNPQLLALLAQEQAASAGIDASVAALFPWVSLSAGKTWSGTNFPLIWNWSYGASLNWNPFDAFRNYNLIDRSSAELRSARAARAAFEQQLYQTLSNAIALFQHARERMIVADLLVEQARENLELYKERFRVGRASAVELTDAEVSLTSARSGQVQARYDYHTALAQIRHTVGGELP